MAAGQSPQETGPKSFMPTRSFFIKRGADPGMSTNLVTEPGDREAPHKSATATIYLGNDPMFTLRSLPDDDSITLSNVQDPEQSCRIPAKLLLILTETLVALRKKRASAD